MEEIKKSPSEKDPNRKKYIAAILILAALVIALGVTLFMGKQTVDRQVASIDTLKVEQLQLKSDLQDMLIQYDTMTVNNEQLTAEIAAQQAEIQEMLKQAEKHKDDAYIISKLKKEAATLRDIMKGYLVTIDSLNTLNIDLRKDNQFLAEELTNVKTHANQLESTNKDLEDIVATGSILQATNMRSEGLRVRNNGSQKEVSRANKAEMIRTCTRLAENRISPAGKKTIYLRIISPDGVVLESKEGMDGRFNFEGVSGKYSVKRVIEYNNEATELCMFYNLSEDTELPSGKFIVEMYESGSLIGKTDFDLK